MKFLFGPVHSRRLGRSLGIDVVPYKTCSLNCIYCEVGATTDLTDTPVMFFPPEKIIRELSDFLKTSPELDVITFSGAGEPLLYEGIGEIVRFLKSHERQYRLALLTNGTLLHRPEIRDKIRDIDIVLPSLDAGTEEVFQRVNRPAEGCTLTQLVDGISALSREFEGEIWLEIFLVPGINTSPEELEQIHRHVQRINPTRIQLNTLDRPGTEPWVRPMLRSEMERIAEIFSPIRVDIAGSSRQDQHKEIPGEKVRIDQIRERILDTVSRRPSTLDDVAMMAGLTAEQVLPHLIALESDSRIERIRQNNGTFYRTCAPES